MAGQGDQGRRAATWSLAATRRRSLAAGLKLSSFIHPDNITAPRALAFRFTVSR